MGVENIIITIHYQF